MPKAFLMHYQKQRGVDVFYQGSNISEDRSKEVKESCAINSVTLGHNLNKMLPKHHNIAFGVSVNNTDDDEDEEISVTDGEETDEEEIDDEEIDDDDEEEDEEINIDDSDCDYNLNNLSNFGSSQSITDIESTTDMVNKNKEIANSSSKIHHSSKVDRSEKVSNNVNHIGSEHSAFSRPPVVLNGDYNSRNSGNNMKTDDLSKLHGGIRSNINIDPRVPIANYWLHMNRMYPGHFPPFHPFPIGIGQPAPTFPIESNISQGELLQRQMLHSQMFYLNGHGMLPPGHPLHTVLPHGHPGLQPLLTTGDDNFQVKIEINESHSSSKTMSVSKRKQLDSCDNRNNSVRTNRISTQTNDIVRNSAHVSKQEGHSILPHMLHHLSASQLPFPPAAIPQSPLPSPVSPVSALQLTPPIPSSMSPPTIFGPTMHPLLYNNMFACGARRPRDPNKPPPVKKYKCDICGKAFSRSNTLVTHRRIHTGEKPFKCEICSRAFRQPGNLTRHRLTHTTVKPYVCVVCKKAFNRASNLHTHMRTHTTFRPFICPYCGKGFQQKVDLKIHMYTHGGMQ